MKTVVVDLQDGKSSPEDDTDLARGAAKRNPGVPAFPIISSPEGGTGIGCSAVLRTQPFISTPQTPALRSAAYRANPVPSSGLVSSRLIDL